MLLDVGAQMGDLLEPAAKTVSEFIHGKVHHEHVASELHVHVVVPLWGALQPDSVHRSSTHLHCPACIAARPALSWPHAALMRLQMINKPTHEVQLIFFGTTGACSKQLHGLQQHLQAMNTPSTENDTCMFLQTHATC